MSGDHMVEIGKLIAEGLKVESGDTVVVTAPAKTPHRLSELFRKTLVDRYADSGKEVLVIVVTGDITIGLIKADKVEEIEARLDAVEGALHQANML